MTNASNDLKEFLRQAAHVTPSPRQLQWYEREFYAFVHFSPNTYTGLEWGRGDEDERIFNPTELDCDQWVEAVKSAGMKGLILTAKHHDGFCLWPSRYTEHSVKNCPVKVDVVREAAEACRRGGIAFGFYLSPWDRNSPLYGTAAYNEYYQNQLTELLTSRCMTSPALFVWCGNISLTPSFFRTAGRTFVGSATSPAGPGGANGPWCLTSCASCPRRPRPGRGRGMCPGQISWTTFITRRKIWASRSRSPALPG